jgi:DNA-binding Lrp family transcriptional regulator
MVTAPSWCPDNATSPLSDRPEIRALHTTNGTWDLIAEIGVDTLPDLDRVLGTIRAIDGIRGSETSILLTSM